jgi:site-specific DNA-methyltransferase (adenine-specific)
VTDQGRFPANFIHDGSDEVVALFPYSKSGAMNGEYNNTIMAQSNGNRDGKTIKLTQQASEGSAARFFYCAKASKRDRNEGLDEFEVKRKVFMATKNGTGEPSKGLERFTTTPSANHHPTVKPTDLMRYLCKLVTPPKGIVLDPFMGSGSTGKGAVLEGFEFIGIEQSAEYCEIAKARIEHTQNNLSEFAQEFLL